MIQVATEGDYGATNATTWVQAGTPEMMVGRAVIRLYKVLGLLYDAPKANWK